MERERGEWRREKKVRWKVDRLEGGVGRVRWRSESGVKFGEWSGERSEEWRMESKWSMGWTVELRLGWMECGVWRMERGEESGEVESGVGNEEWSVESGGIECGE